MKKPKQPDAHAQAPEPNRLDAQARSSRSTGPRSGLTNGLIGAVAGAVIAAVPALYIHFDSKEQSETSSELPGNIEGKWRALGSDIAVPGASIPAYYVYEAEFRFQQSKPTGPVTMNGDWEFRGRHQEATDKGMDHVVGRGRVNGDFLHLTYSLAGDDSPAEGGGVMSFQFKASGKAGHGYYVTEHVDTGGFGFGHFCLFREGDRAGEAKCRGTTSSFRGSSASSSSQ